MWHRVRRRQLLAAAVMTWTLAAGCGFVAREPLDLPPPVAPPQRSTKEIYTVRRGEIVERVRLRTLVVPANETALFFRQAGRLRRLHVNAGDRVRAGQLLAELETGDLETQVQLSQINVDKLALRLEQALEQSRAQGGPDRFDLAMLELDLKAARLTLAQQRRHLDQAQLRAPFAGEITLASGSPGEEVAAYQAVVVVSDPAVLEIRSEVDDATLARLAPGQRAKLTFAETGEAVFDGSLVQVPDPFRSEPPPPGRGHLAKVAPDTPVAGLKQGMSGYADVILQARQDVLVLPNAALRSYAGRVYVVVLEGDSRREVDVSLGIRGETESEITGGLKEGQQVIGR